MIGGWKLTEKPVLGCNGEKFICESGLYLSVNQLREAYL